MNSLSEDDLEKTNFKDRISSITQARKVVKKYHHLDTVQENVDILAHQVKLFIDMFDPLFKKGLPYFQKEKGAMLTQNEYHENLMACRLDHTNFADMNQSLSGRVIVDKLADKFEMVSAFKEACAQLRSVSYQDHIELCMLQKGNVHAGTTISISVEYSREVQKDQIHIAHPSVMRNKLR